MRNLVFKNLTSREKKRRILSTYETVENKGVLTRIKRNFVYIIKDAGNNKKTDLPLPQINVLKIKNSRTRCEKFFCRIKGGLYVANNDKLFFVNFSHSLAINLTPATTAINQK